MSRSILVLILSFLAFNATCQYDGRGANEVSRFRPGVMWFFSGFRPAETEKPTKYDRLIFDLTYNDWLGDREPFTNKGASMGLNTNLMFDFPLTKGNQLSLGIGVAHSYVTIRHDNKFVIDDAENSTIFTLKDSTDFFRKGILAGNSFSIPIELRIRKESWRHFKIHFGGKIGYQANLYSKEISFTNGHKNIAKRFGFPDENKLLYSVHARLGFRNFAFYGSLNLNSFFSNSQSTQLQLLQMGLSISLF